MHLVGFIIKKYTMLVQTSCFSKVNLSISLMQISPVADLSLEIKKMVYKM